MTSVELERLNYLSSKVIVATETKEEADYVSPKKNNLLITLKEDGFNDLPRILKLVQVSHTTTSE